MKISWKFVKIILVNLTILLILLITLDLFLGVPQSYTERSIVLRELGVDMDVKYKVPTAEFEKITIGLEQKTYRLRTDHNGFIIGENNLLRNDETADIIFFGGSTTECTYVDESRRFPYLVQEKLSVLLNSKVTALNAGFSGNNTLHSTLSLLSKGIRRSPKIVVLMHNINDLSGLDKSGSYYVQPNRRNPIQSKSLYLSPIGARIAHLKNALIPNLYESVQGLTGSDIYDDEWKKLRNQDTIAYSRIEHEFEKAVRSFVQIAKIHGIRVILMTQFNRINKTDNIIDKYPMAISGSFIENYARLNAKIIEIAENEQIDVIDLASLVPGNNEYIYDAVHLNSKGSESVAELITDFLYEKGYLSND